MVPFHKDLIVSEHFFKTIELYAIYRWLPMEKD